MTAGSRWIGLATLLGLALAGCAGSAPSPAGPRPQGPAGPSSAADRRPRAAGAAAGQYAFDFDVAARAFGQGQGRVAIAWYEQAAADAERRGDREEAGLAHALVAFVAIRASQYQKVITAGQRALELLPADGVDRRLARARFTAFTTVGKAYRMAGDVDRALWHYGQARAFLEASPARNASLLRLSILAHQLGVIALQRRDEITAEAEARRATDLADEYLAGLPEQAPAHVRAPGRKQAVWALALRARAALQAGRLDDAEQRLAEAAGRAADLESPVIRLAVSSLAADLAEALGQWRRALALSEEGIALAGRLDRPAAVAGFRAVQARSLRELGRVDEALAAVRTALASVEDLRSELQDPDLRIGFVDDRRRLYQTAVGIAMQARHPEEAFAFAERGRARALLDLLGDQAALSKGRTRALLAEELQLQARMAEARALVETEPGPAAQTAAAAVDREYRAFVARVRKDSAEQASLMSVEPVSLAEIQGLLAPGTALLEYFVTGHAVFLWVVDRDGMRAFRSPVDRAALAAEVRAFREAITGQVDLATVEAMAAGLSARLLGPARRALTAPRLVIVPHDVLHYLPFAALRTPGGRWLAEEHVITTLPSASVLRYVSDRRRSGSRPLVVGNPGLGRRLDLPYAEREARLVARSQAPATVLVGAEATEQRVKELLPGASLVHLAVHAVLDEREPLASALLLVPGSGEDGRLSVRELFGLEVGASLVVLSACETGLGALSRGDELMSLQRAFLYAGTPSVVATLWKVDDRATYELMRDFYRAYRGPERRSPAEAFHAAQGLAIREAPHPYAWAGYVLTGVPW